MFSMPFSLIKINVIKLERQIRIFLLSVIVAMLYLFLVFICVNKVILVLLASLHLFQVLSTILIVWVHDYVRCLYVVSHDMMRPNLTSSSQGICHAIAQRISNSFTMFSSHYNRTLNSTILLEDRDHHYGSYQHSQKHDSPSNNGLSHGNCNTPPPQTRHYYNCGSSCPWVLL